MGIAGESIVDPLAEEPETETDIGEANIRGGQSRERRQTIDQGYLSIPRGSGGIFSPYAWMYNGVYWGSRAKMTQVRDRPACSLVQLSNKLDNNAGNKSNRMKINILIAGGCDGWCQQKPPVKTAELYDPETNSFTKVADLPVALSSAKMELL